MLCEQSCRRGFGGEIGVETKHEIGFGVGAFELEPVEDGYAIAKRHPLNLTIAVRLESGLDFGAWPPFRDEALISVDGQDFFCRRRGCESEEGKRKKYVFHDSSIHRGRSLNSARNP